MAIYYVGGGAARALALRSPAIVRAKERRQRDLDCQELGADRSQLFRRRLYRRVAGDMLCAARSALVGSAPVGGSLALVSTRVPVGRGPALFRCQALCGAITFVWMLFHGGTNRSSYNTAKICVLGVRRVSRTSFQKFGFVGTFGLPLRAPNSANPC